jgi:hypothetical protein
MPFFLSWNAGDPHFLSFLFGRAYYKEVYFKKKKKKLWIKN